MAVKSLIETVTVGASGAASIEFTAIPQNGSDLILVISNRVSNAQFSGNLEFNSDTAANYSHTRLFTNGAGIFTDAGATTSISFIGLGRSDFTANTFASDSIYVSNYSSGSAKSVSIEGVTENNSGSAYEYALGLAAGSYSDTNPITSLKVYGVGSTFVQHTTASLYKIKYD